MIQDELDKSQELKRLKEELEGKKIIEYRYWIEQHEQLCNIGIEIRDIIFDELAKTEKIKIGLIEAFRKKQISIKESLYLLQKAW